MKKIGKMHCQTNFISFLIIGDWGFTLIASPWTAIGVLGNILVLVVILTSKSMRSSTNIFLLNLRHFNTTQKL